MLTFNMLKQYTAKCYVKCHFADMVTGRSLNCSNIPESENCY